MKRSLLFPVVLALACPVASFALGIRIVDQDAEATARSEAFTATADNPSAIYYNPAGITQIEGLSARVGTYAIGIHVHYSPEDGDGLETKEKTLFTPQAYLTYTPKNVPFSLGLGVYSPYGLELEYPDDAPFRTVAKFGGLQMVTVNPVIALKVSRTFSLAAGLTLNSGQVELTQGLFPPPMGNGDEFKFKGEGTSAGFNLGAMWKPTEKHSFGISYHSGISVDFSGHTSARLSDRERAQAKAGNKQIEQGKQKLAQGIQQIQSSPLPPAVKQQLIANANAQFQQQLAANGVPASGSFPTGFPEEDADARIRFPQFIMAGYSFRPTPDWNFEVDVDWTDWDVLDTVELHQQHSGTVKLPFNWKNSFIYEFGMTRKLPYGLRASAGYAYSENSVPSESFNPIVPDSNRHIFSVGLGQTVQRINWDLAYQFAWGPPRTIDNDTLVDGRYRFHSHAVTLSVGYNF